MSSTDGLKLRAAERERLLESILEMLKQDRRVACAWLGGSIGRGFEDDLSDLDIYVVLYQQYARYVFKSTREFVSRIDGLLLVEREERNAPVEGAYLFSLYHGDTGPHQVDWYWLTDRIQSIPPNARVLYNPASIAVESMQFASMARLDIDNEIAGFWAMAAIAARKIMRGHVWSAIAALARLRSLIDDVSWHIGASDAAPSHIDLRSDAPPVTAELQLAELERLITEMVQLTANADVENVPNASAMSAELAPLIELARTVIAESA